MHGTRVFIYRIDGVGEGMERGGGGIIDEIGLSGSKCVCVCLYVLAGVRLYLLAPPSI